MASDNVGVTQVTWTNSRGGSGTATGATSWTASGIVLQAGSNVLTVTARDAAGNAGTATLTATFDNTQTPTIPAPPAPPVPIPPAGLVAAYSFDEGAGTFVADSSGNNNLGTLKGSVAWTTGGRFGNALSFSGGTITVPAAASLDLTTAMTLEAWVYPTAAPSTWGTVVMKEQSGEFVYTLYAGSPSAQPYALINTGNSASTESGTFAPTTLPVNTWSHLTSTYDGANVRLYVNGVLMGSQPASGSIATSSGALMLGGNNVWGEYLSGVIDEVRIYNRALSLAEIQADMNTAVGAKPATDTTPPAVAIASPVGGATVAGILPVAAVASDNVGVVGVQFLLDGAPVGQEQGAAPFSIPWNTANAGNGFHILSARARDAAGNTAVAANVTVNVVNLTIPAPPVPIPPGPSPTPSAGLVAAYGFEEGGGSTVADASGNNNTGTLSGGVSWTTGGRFGNALVFNGANLVSIPPDRSLDLTTAMTLEAWVYPTVAPTNWTTVLMKEQSDEFVYTLYSGSSSSQPYALINTGNSAATEQGTFASTTLPVNTWSHLAATYDGANVRLYVNGVLMGSQPASGSIAASNGTLVLGGNNVWGEYFTGLIDEVRIYNRALSMTEIQDDMNTAVAGR